jgi:hypothetical protein
MCCQGRGGRHRLSYCYSMPVYTKTNSSPKNIRINRKKRVTEGKEGKGVIWDNFFVLFGLAGTHGWPMRCNFWKGEGGGGGLS